MSDFIQLLTPISIIAGIIFGYYQLRRNQKHDDHSESAKNTTFAVKLEHISSQISDMKAEFRAEFNTLKSDAKLDHDELIVLKRDVKTLYSKFDELKK